MSDNRAPQPEVDANVLHRRRAQPTLLMFDERSAPIGNGASSLHSALVDAAREAAIEAQTKEVLREYRLGNLLYRLRAVPIAGNPRRTGVFVEEVRRRDPAHSASRRFHFSAREAQILALLVTGISDDEIADTLEIAPATVEKHIRRMCRRAGYRRRGELLAEVLLDI